MADKAEKGARRAYLALSADVLGMMLAAVKESGVPEAGFALTLRDDQSGAALGRFNVAGAAWLYRLLSEHECRRRHDGESICPVMYLAWVIQGCRADGESFGEAFGRNAVRLVKKIDG